MTDLEGQPQLLAHQRHLEGFYHPLEGSVCSGYSSLSVGSGHFLDCVCSSPPVEICQATTWSGPCYFAKFYRLDFAS